MAITYYDTGTISLTNGSAVVTGVGTGWQTALITGGVIYPEAAGNPLPIASVNSNVSITAAMKWTGATGTYSYALARQDDVNQVLRNAQALSTYLSRLDNDALAALAALDPSAGKVPAFTGDASAELLTLSTLGRSLMAMAGANGSIPVVADQAISARPIVGSVSQTGGLPGGALIERGSNSNGQFVRFADGTQIAWGLQSFNVVVPAGQSTQPSLVPPASFVGTAKTLVQAAYYTGLNGGGVALYTFNFGSNFTNSATASGIQFLNGGTSPATSFPSFTIGSTASASLLLNFITVGRWF